MNNFESENKEMEINIEEENKEAEINTEKENLIINGLSIGTVSTGDEASATITGSSPYQKLNLVLPRGEQGPQGEAGPQGPAGQDGTDGTDGITPHIGDNGNWFLGDEDTGKPSRGEQGPQGLKGETGEQGPQGIQGEQGPQGLKGDTGDTGPQGPAGKDGVSIIAGNAWEPTQQNGYTVTDFTLNKSDGNNITISIKAKNGKDGTSASVIEATDENNALTLSSQNPNNIYYWE